jgi:serine phosphatase RsbU (regulator of sigma subunit)
VTAARRGEVTGPVGGGAPAPRHLDTPPPSAPALPASPPSAPPPDPPDDALARDLLDGLTEAVIAVDARGVVTLVNAAASRLLPEVGVGGRLGTYPIPPPLRADGGPADAFDTEHGGRRLHGVRRRLGDGGFAWYVRDVTEEHAGVGGLLAERGRSAFLAEAGDLLGRSLHHAQILRTTVTLPVPYLADAVVVIRRPKAPLPPGAELNWIRHAAGEDGPVTGRADAGLAAAVPGLAEAMAGDPGDPGDPGPWVDDRPPDLGPVLPAGFGPAGTVLTAPLVGAGGVPGALVAVRRPDRPGFDERDVDLLRQFAARASAALSIAELYGEQARLARVLQASLLPPELPRIAGVTLAGGYRAGGDSLRIGGDFYDVLPDGEGGGMFALGDVCGKGIGAAVLTGRVRQTLHTLRLVEDRPLHLMELLNRALFNAPDAARRSQFTTLLLGTFAPDPAGGLRLRIAGGGHPAPLVARADGTVAPVRVGGMPVGALANAGFTEISIRLGPGDLLLAYSDGITEARGGPDRYDMYGEARLCRALAAGVDLPTGPLVGRILQLVDEWLGGQGHDDIAVLAVRAARAER